MAVNPLTTDTILAVDFGTATTRALLFDVVENAYRLIGYGEAPSTIDPPYSEAAEGLNHALVELQSITGRALLSEGGRLIMPASSDGRGADACVITSSAGPALRTILVGLLPDVSLDSVRRVAAGTYLSVLDTFSLGDRRGEDEQIDAVIAARPELILIAGGTEDGASEALLKLVETVSLACHLLPPETKSRALFMGNATLAPRMAEMLGKVARVYNAPNVQPELGFERLAPARTELARLYQELRLEQIGGFGQLAQWGGGRIQPTAEAAGLLVRFLSLLPAWPRGVLGVDVGSASAHVAAAWRGDLRLSVRTDLGLGTSAANFLERSDADASLEWMSRWVPGGASIDAMREFVLNKSLHPHTVAVEKSDLYLEHALARHMLRGALQGARPDWPEDLPGPRPDLMPWLSLILGSGAVLGQSPQPGLAALLLLDGLQPSGVTRLMLDPYQLAAALGAVAQINQLAAAQVCDSLAFIDLGSAITIVGRGAVMRPGDVVCVATLVPQSGSENEIEVHAGALELLQLAAGQSAKLILRPRPGYNAGFGPGRGRTLNLKGGAVGIIIDARGRPIVLPRGADERQQAVQGWTSKLAGVA